MILNRDRRLYLHIGNGKSIRQSHIVGIFDLDTATVSKISRSFINRASKEGRLAYTDDDLPRSFILCEERVGKIGKSNERKKRDEISLSRISTSGLLLRTRMKLGEEE